MELALTDCNGSAGHWRSLAAHSCALPCLRRLDLSAQRMSLRGLAQCTDVAQACTSLTWLQVSSDVAYAEKDLLRKELEGLREGVALRIECFLNSAVGAAFE